MIVNKAGLASLYDLYKSTNLTPHFNSADQSMITERMWNLYWTIHKKTYNYLGSGSGTPNFEPFWKNITLQCLDLMDHVANYMVGEFDCHNDKNLQRIWPILIKSWYFGKVWVIKSEEVMQREITLAESEAYRNNISIEKLHKGNPFRLFELQSIDNGKYYFKSLLTGIDNFELDPNEMIFLSLNEGSNWRKWWKINMEYLSGRSRVVDALVALSKTTLVTVKNKDAFENEISQMQNPSVMFQINRRTGAATEQNNYSPMPIIEGDRVQTMFDLVYSMYGRDCGILGFTVNSSDKKERLTVGENYRDLRQITNIQDFNLKNLKIFEENLKEKGWVEENFRIEIAGLAFGEGLPDTVNAGAQDEFPPGFQQGPQNNK